MKTLNSLVFVKHTERVQEREVGSNALKVLLRDVAIMVMIVISKHRLPGRDTDKVNQAFTGRVTEQLNYA